MPLLCFDLIQGRSENQIKRILDVTHKVMVNAFNVPRTRPLSDRQRTWAIQNDHRGYGPRHRANF
jgi:Tautomerase enzyme